MPDKMNNLGKKIETNGVLGPSRGENTIRYPGLTLRSDKMPEIKKWENGKKYTLKIIVEQKRSGESYDDDKLSEAEFDILEAGVLGSPVDKEDYDKMSAEEKDKEDEKEVLGK